MVAPWMAGGLTTRYPGLERRTMQSLPHAAPGDQAAICAGVHEQGLALGPGLLSPQTSAEVCRWIDALVMEPGDDDGDSDSTEYYNLSLIHI